ncbi:hypothetical protein L9F63_009221, partial [Diploptera punctata]
INKLIVFAGGRYFCHVKIIQIVKELCEIWKQRSDELKSRRCHTIVKKSLDNDEGIKSGTRI